MTTFDNETEVKKAYRLGANSFVLKTMEYRTYLKKVLQIADYWLHANL